MIDSEALAVTRQVTVVLDRLGVPYVIGGSLASVVHGMVRATLDVAYLRQWALPLRVSDLLERALVEAGSE